MVSIEVTQEFIDAVAAAVVKLNGNTATSPVAVTEKPDPWATMPDATSAPPVAPVAPVQPAPQPVAPVAPVAAPQPARATVTLPTGVFSVQTPNGVQSWTLGAPNAPQCQHGTGAAYVQGKKNGKPWSAWRCAYGAGDAIGVNWKDKCEFSVWA